MGKPKGQYRCAHCDALKLKRVLDQRYCGAAACQRARKNRWRRDKYAGDIDYRQNQRESTQRWLSSQGGAAAYYRAYRQARSCAPESPPLAVEPPTGIKSANSGATRCANSDATEGANSDGKKAETLFCPGTYIVSPTAGANSDAFLMKIGFIPEGYGDLQRST